MNFTDNETNERLDAFLGNCGSCFYYNNQLCACPLDRARPGQYWWPRNACSIATYRTAYHVTDLTLVANQNPCHAYKRRAASE